MCYQAFIHHVCGHDEIIGTTCELADGQTFWFKPACQQYQFDSKFPDSFCGVGRFYCTHAEADGRWLDAVQEGLWRCNAEICVLDGKIWVVLDKVRTVFPLPQAGMGDGDSVRGTAAMKTTRSPFPAPNHSP